VRRVVSVLGVLAVLCVAGSATLASVHRPAPAAPASAAAASQWLRGYGMQVALPRGHWTLEPADQAIRYDADALVRAPAVYDVGFCPSAASSSRAFVGLLPPVADAAPKVVTRAAVAWARGISGRAIGIAGTPDGSRLDLDVPVPSGPCHPTTAHLTVVGRTAPEGVVVLVLVRDVGEPGDLSVGEADRIVSSLRVAR
jgi:hypothetical protein